MKTKISVRKMVMVGLIGVATIMSLGACKKEDSKEIDINTASKKLLSEISYEDELSEVDFDLVYDMEGIEVNESVVYVSSGATAEEIAAFQCKTEDDAKKAQEVLENRVEEQKESFQNYVPEELEKLDKAVIIKEGKSVVLSISNDDPKAKEIIGEAVK